METILRTVFGSHLYGTDTPASDRDFKSVHLPSCRDILLGRVEPVIVRNTKAESRIGFTEKNTAGDVDDESYSLGKYLHLVSQGQTVALDILFAVPPERVPYEHWLWREIYRNRDKLASKQCASFIGYCRQQSAKYGLKGSRVAAVRKVVEMLQSIHDAGEHLSKLSTLEGELMTLCEDEFISIEAIRQVSGADLKHLNCCNRKAPFTITVKEALKIYRSLLDEYGRRALQAEKNEGVDWKALSHAVRIGRQAIEYLQTGFVTFPRPERVHLLDIKTGQLPYQHVAEEIEQLLVDVETEAARSSLPDQPDRKWIDQFVYDAHRGVVLEEYFHTIYR